MQLRVLTVMFSLLFLLGTSCLSTGPSQDNFLITDILFSGDSSAGGQLQPYCEFTIEWNEPAAGSNSTFTLYRSEVPSIQSDPSAVPVVCVTTSNSGTDSYQLQWGTEYFYAVMAESSSGDQSWSSEVSTKTPSSPYPVPCELSLEKTGFTRCLLTWTVKSGDFQSYTVIRCTEPGIEGLLWYADTLFTTTDRDSIQYTDSAATAVESSYYVVAVSESSGLSGFSNEVELIPGGEVPWFVSNRRNMYGLNADNYSISDDGNRLLTTVDLASYSVGYVLDASDGYPLEEFTADVDFLGELSDGSLGVGLALAAGHRFALYTSDFSEEIASRFFPPVISMTELEEGILLGTSSITELVDPVSLETILSASFGCQDAILSSDRQRVFVLSNSGVLLVNLSDLSIIQGIPGSFTSIQKGSDGYLRCINSARVEIYDMETLAMLTLFLFPEQADKDEVTLLPPECDVAYVPVFEEGSLVFRVWNITTGVDMGTVRSEFADFIDLKDLIPSPQGEYLWCLGYQSDMPFTLLKISL